MEVFYQNQFLGTISKAAVSTFYLACIELGIQIDRDDELQQMLLSPGLAHTQVLFRTDSTKELYKEAVQLLLKEIQESLYCHDIQCYQEMVPEEGYDMDLVISLTLADQTEHLNPIVKVIGNYAIHDEWFELLSVECVKEGIHLEVEKNSEALGTLSFVLFLPEITDMTNLTSSFAKFSHILTITILSYLKKKYGLSTLALFPAEAFPLSSFLTLPPYEDNQESTEDETLIDMKSKEKTYRDDNVEFDLKKEIPFKEAYAYFSYHVLLNQAGNQPAKVFGDFTIKNAGNIPLNNPHICFRMTPAGSLHLTGQILPPKTAQTLGIHTATGAKGWMYMREDWLEEAVEKGEIWVSPIQSVEILPHEDIALSGLQIKFIAIENVRDLKVEAFVYFPEQDYRIMAVNKISIIQVAGTTLDVE